MNRIKTIGLALVAVFAFSAVAATVASAVEGPFYKVNGTRLAAGQTRLLLASAKEKFVLKATALKISITCTGLTLPLAGQMFIQGLAAGNGSISKEALEFSGCAVVGNGEPCEPVGKVIKTQPVLNLLGYGNEARTGSVLVLFEPESGTKFVNIKFTGAGCKNLETNVEGNVVGQARVAGSPIIIGSEPAETLHGEVAFPHPNLIFIEREFKLKHVKAGLNAFGVGSSLEGVALIQVDEGGVAVKWGVFTA